MTMTPTRGTQSGTQPPDAPVNSNGKARVGAYPWAMAGAVSLAVGGAALSLNGVLRGWAWYWPVVTTVLVVSFSLAALRSARAHPLLVTAGGFLSLGAILTLTFFRDSSVAGVIPTGASPAALDRLIRRASETVLGETAPVAPNVGIVMVICAVLGLAVILVDALALPLGMPAATGVGLLAIMVVPAVIKPQSVGFWSFAAAVAGYLAILACSQWFAPDARLQGDLARNPGQLRRAALTGSVALAATLVIPAAIPGFDQGTFPQGARLNPWGSATGLNPMITLGNSLRTPDGSGRITYATNAPAPLYLRSVTVDHFDGESWGPDDREASRLPLGARIDPGYGIPGADQLQLVTAVDTGTFTSQYLPAPYAPETVGGLDGRWTWDPATLSIKGTDTTSRRQEYVVMSSAPQLTPDVLARSAGAVQGIADDFTRIPGNVPEIVRTTASTVAGAGSTPYQKAMAIQRYLRSAQFTYSLQSPVQGGYDGNGLSVLADFLEQKSGYCIHYASAMAVMARLEGIPSRIAVGYAPGRPTGATVSVPGQGALPEYEVDGRDAHAWPELYFEGLGWVPFEPTPSRGVVPDYARESSAAGSPGSIDNNDGLIPDATAAPTTTPGATPAPLPGGGGAANGGGGLFGWLWGAGSALGVVLLAVAPRLVRAGLRASRLRPRSGAISAASAWREMVDLGTDYGLPPKASETPRAYSARLLSSLPGTSERGGAGVEHSAHLAAVALTGAFERHKYGPPVAARLPEGHEGGAAPAGDKASGAAQVRVAAQVAAVEEGLSSSASYPRRLLARWFPASVMKRLRRLMAAPFQGGGRALRKAAGALRRRVRRQDQPA